MKIFTKGIILGLSIFAMSGCSLLGGGLGGGAETFTQAKFVEKGKDLEDTTKKAIEETNTFTVKTTKMVEGVSNTYTLSATRDSKYTFTSDETNSDLKNEVIAQEIFWEQKAMYKLANLIEINSGYYKEFVFEKKADGSFALEKANSERMEFNKDGVLTLYKDMYSSGNYTLREYSYSK